MKRTGGKRDVSLPIAPEILAAAPPRAWLTLDPKRAGDLEDVELFATEVGVRACLDAANALGEPTHGWPLEQSFASIAIHVVTRASQAVRECARFELFRSYESPRWTREFPLRDDIEALPVPPAAALAERLRDVLGKRADDVIPIATNDVEVHRRSVGGALASDRVAFDGKRRVLRITTCDPRVLELLRAAFGEATADDRNAFTTEPTCTLAPIRDRGEAALSVDALAAEVRSVRVTDLLWDSGDADVAWLGGRDVFRAAEDRGWTLVGGRALKATLRVELVRGERFSVVVWPPNRVRVPRGKHEATAWRVLDVLGLLRPDRSPRTTLRRLSPFLLSPSEWRAAIGDAYEALDRMGVLVAHQRRAVSHPDYPHHGRVLVAMPRAGDGYYGASFDPDVPSTALTGDDLEARKLDVVGYAARIAEALDLERAPQAIEGRGGVDLGRRTFRRREAQLFFAPAGLGPRSASTIELLGHRAAGAVPVLIVPPGGRIEGPVAPLRQIEMPSLTGPYRELLAPIAHALGEGANVDAVEMAPEDAMLVIDASTHTVWVRRDRMTRATELHARYLAVLDAKGPLAGKDVAAALGYKNAKDTFARDLARRVPAAIAASFEDLGKNPPFDPKTIVTRDARGYRLGVKAFVRGAP